MSRTKRRKLGYIIKYAFIIGLFFKLLFGIFNYLIGTCTTSKHYKALLILKSVPPVFCNEFPSLTVTCRTPELKSRTFTHVRMRGGGRKYVINRTYLFRY